MVIPHDILIDSTYGDDRLCKHTTINRYNYILNSSLFSATVEMYKQKYNSNKYFTGFKLWFIFRQRSYRNRPITERHGKCHNHEPRVYPLAAWSRFGLNEHFN